MTGVQTCALPISHEFSSDDVIERRHGTPPALGVYPAENIGAAVRSARTGVFLLALFHDQRRAAAEFRWDLARVGRQQRLLRAVLEKAIRERLWTKVIALYRLKKRYVQTDLGIVDLYRLRDFGERLVSGEDLRTFSVPGNFAGPYWAPDHQALQGLIAREFAVMAAPNEATAEKETGKRR